MHLAIRMFYIYVVISGTAKRYKTDSNLIELVNYERINIVVYENTSNITAFSKLISIWSKSGLQESDLEFASAVSSLKLLPVVFFCVEKSYFIHNCHPILFMIDSISSTNHIFHYFVSDHPLAVSYSFQI